MDAKAAPTPFVPTFTLLIGGGVLLAGLFTMLGDAGSTAPGLALATIGWQAVPFKSAPKRGSASPAVWTVGASHDPPRWSFQTNHGPVAIMQAKASNQLTRRRC